jgi:hypothetical protein
MSIPLELEHLHVFKNTKTPPAHSIFNGNDDHNLIILDEEQNSLTPTNTGNHNSTENTFALCSNNDNGSDRRSALLKQPASFDLCVQLSMSHGETNAYRYGNTVNNAPSVNANQKTAMIEKPQKDHGGDNDVQSQQSITDVEREYENQLETAKCSEQNLLKFKNTLVPSLLQNDNIIRSCTASLQKKQLSCNTFCIQAARNQTLRKDAPSFLRLFYDSSLPCFEAFAKEFCSEVCMNRTIVAFENSFYELMLILMRFI